MIKRKVGILSVILYLFISVVVFAQTPKRVTLVTFFPAPSGAYNSLRANTLCAGTCAAAAANALEVKNTAGTNVLAVNATTATISAPTTLQSTLTVNKATTFNGSTTLVSTLAVSGSTMLTGANVAGRLQVANSGEFVLPIKNAAYAPTVKGTMWFKQ